MLFVLFIKECRQTLKSITYYILILCMVMFYHTQMGDFEMVEKPLPGQEDYGTTYSQDENIIIEKSLEALFREYSFNHYVTYPIGFYKTVTLNESKQSEIGDILCEITGLPKEELIEAGEAFKNDSYETWMELNIEPVQSMTYEHFAKLMEKADKLLGSGSSYSKTMLRSNARTPKTYEEAVLEYNDLIEKDRLSGAYARLFCDYIGIILAILPVFLAVARGLRDKRASAEQILYSKRASSFSIILSRYLAMVFMVLVPVLIMSFIMNVQCVNYGVSIGVEADQFMFLKYVLGWLLPSIMITISVGVLLTELTETAIGILVQGIWWFASLFSGVANLMGSYDMNLIPRHNTLGNYSAFQDNLTTLMTNRIIYTAAAVVLIVIAAIIYDNKRRGKLRIHGKISTNRKRTSKV
jgi:ABC-2 type transport system permease protein